jgi:hypothetical protein
MLDDCLLRCAILLRAQALGPPSKAVPFGGDDVHRTSSYFRLTLAVDGPDIACRTALALLRKRIPRDRGIRDRPLTLALAELVAL